MSGIEDKVRAALSEQTNAITPATLRHPELPKPRRHLLPVPVMVAALIAAMLIGGSIGMAAFRDTGTALAAAQRVPSVTAGATLPSQADQTIVDGIAIPTPPGWSVIEMEPRPGARQVCLATAGEAGDDCANGMTFMIASTVDGVTATIATQPPDLCRGATQVMTYNPAAVLDGRAAVQYRIQCDGEGPTAEYWQLADQSLSISTPLAVVPQTYAEIIAGIDLSGWAHQL